MTFKLNIGDKGKTYKMETNSENFMGKKVGETISGKDIPEFKELGDYEFKITGASDKQGFPVLEGVEGVGLKRVLLKRGKGMRKKKPKGLRLRKTVHTNNISQDIVQINLSIIKQGSKPLAEIFGKKEGAKEVKQKMEDEQKQEEKEEEKTEEKEEEKPEEEKTEETEEKEEEKTEEKAEEEETTEEEKPAEEEK